MGVHYGHWAINYDGLASSHYIAILHLLTKLSMIVIMAPHFGGVVQCNWSRKRSSWQTYEQEKVDHVAVGPLKVGPIPDQRHDDRLDGVAR